MDRPATGTLTEVPVWLAIIGAFLVGGLDFGRVFTQMHALDGSDVPLTRAHRLMAGFGNVFKGVLGATAGWWAGEWGDPASSAAAFAAGAATVAGHTFPIFHRLRGSVAAGPAAGVGLFLIPIPSVGAVVAGWSVRVVTKSTAAGVGASAATLLLGAVLGGIGGWPLLWLSAMLILVLSSKVMAGRSSPRPSEEQQSV